MPAPHGIGAGMTELSPRLARLKFRAWHRGTREADYMIGCFFDRFHSEWTESDIDLFERMIEEEDVDIMAWALGTQSIPEEYRGPMLDRMMKLDYVEIPRD
ncbi:antitoxin CptB [Novosphingobium gossypii]